MLKWALERIDGKAAAIDTPIGRVPTPESLDVAGLDMTEAELHAALAVDVVEWRGELRGIDEWFEKIGAALPTSLRDELASLKLRLGAWSRREWAVACRVGACNCPLAFQLPTRGSM